MTTTLRNGGRMAAEIAEQPAQWRTLLDDAGPDLSTRGRPHPRLRPAPVLARRPRHQRPRRALRQVPRRDPARQAAGLVSPSTMTAYGARPDFRGVLMLAVSQSGGSPDLVRSLEVARECGALTVAVTNNAASDLARAATAHVDVLAGPERAVAATKSYTAQLLALHQLLDRVGGGNGAAAAGLPDLADAVLERGGEVAALADRYRFAQRMVTTGRGYSYPTAREAALKLMETAYVSAQAFSAADLLHGPLAMIDPHVPVLAVVADGIGGRAMAPVLPRLADRGADVCVVGSAAAARRRGRCPPARPRSSRRCWRSCRSSCSRCTWPSRAGATRTRRAASPR